MLSCDGVEIEAQDVDKGAIEEGPTLGVQGGQLIGLILLGGENRSIMKGQTNGNGDQAPKHAE